MTGAAVAKSQEDTAFYREVRLLSANEVGGEPDDDALGDRRLSPRDGAAGRSNAARADADLLARHQAVARTRGCGSPRSPTRRSDFAAWFRICQGFAPERLNPNLVWYVAQTFLALDQADGDVADRLAEHVVKALREAKSETFWTAPDVELEEAAQTYVRRLVSHFPRHAIEVTPILEVADRLSLIQTALKLTVPGIPDIYQGCELAFYALTDPDNRREVDFQARIAALDAPDILSRPLDQAKFDLTRTLLELRRERPELVLSGSYEPLGAPSGLCAFARRWEGTSLLVAVALEPSAGALDAVLGPGERIWPRDLDPDCPVLVAVSEA